MVKDALPYSFADNFLVLNLRACDIGTQFSKYSMIIVSLLLLSSKSHYAYPKSWQRQVLLHIRIMSDITVRRFLTKYIFFD